MPRSILAFLLVVLASVAAGCGGSDVADAGDPAAPIRGSDQASPANASCGKPPAGVVGSGRTVDLDAARGDLDAATRRATRSGHRFVTTATIRARDGLTLRATLRGRRLPDNTSAGTVTWHGLVGRALPTLRLRIVDDTIYLRLDDDPWQAAGSASGIALDVGRELFTHPFLLTTTDAARRGADLLVALEAPAGDLRTYASTERRGLATELLRGARSLEIDALVRGRASEGANLLGDRFTLVTTLPDRLARFAGNARVTVTARTGYCPLRAVDRTAIAAPTVSRS